jgi:hypothetical protein
LGIDGGPMPDSGPRPDAFMPIDAWQPLDAYVPSIDETDCVLHLAFEEAAWTGTGAEAVDGCGARNDGTAHGGAQTMAGGVIGRAARFDGTGCVSVDDAAELRPSTALTFAAWFRPIGIDPGWTSGIVSKRWSYGADDGAFTSYLQGQLLSIDIDSTNDRIHTTFNVSNDTWYHLAVTFDGNATETVRVRVYIDGVLLSAYSERSSTIRPVTSPVAIGCLPDGGYNQNFPGMIDEVYVWRRVLDDAEVEAVYDVGARALGR